VIAGGPLRALEHLTPISCYHRLVTKRMPKEVLEYLRGLGKKYGKPGGCGQHDRSRATGEGQEGVPGGGQEAEGGAAREGAGGRTSQTGNIPVESGFPPPTRTPISNLAISSNTLLTWAGTSETYQDTITGLRSAGRGSTG
jgi:hypothetical protein